MYSYHLTMSSELLLFASLPILRLSRSILVLVLSMFHLGSVGQIREVLFAAISILCIRFARDVIPSRVFGHWCISRGLVNVWQTCSVASAASDPFFNLGLWFPVGQMWEQLYEIFPLEISERSRDSSF